MVHKKKNPKQEKINATIEHEKVQAIFTWLYIEAPMAVRNNAWIFFPEVEMDPGVRNAHLRRL